MQLFAASASVLVVLDVLAVRAIAFDGILFCKSACTAPRP